MAENVLRVTGEDAVEVDRKNLPPVTARLSARFVMLTNELPRLADASGALASRFVVLRMDRSFYGREDLGLTQRLLAELPGILCWAVEGWRRLKARGYFVPPRSSATALEDLADLASPIGAFLRDRCVLAPDACVGVDALFTAWRAWCMEEGIVHVGAKAHFARDVHAAVAGLQVTQPRTPTGRVRTFVGVGLQLPGPGTGGTGGTGNSLTHAVS